ncbi:hypothetical protein BZA05DRAFT_448179 [Tricharina praecox]|uniref:uncharacterized protein n=1 Tax=Tricharina praecox TaxID=43433 RepID=UPI0022206A77|nr:uncharacterized protein BZA05DRAFT_448179 [Tricharina praecox]KAI5844689.1 hypothetical protein BZA05DRAFT_448179 [Tricharina praecox]
MDPQSLYISQVTLARIDGLHLQLTNDPVLLHEHLGRLPGLVLRYIDLLERAVTTKTAFERGFIDCAYNKLKQALTEIPWALATGRNMWTVFRRYLLVVHFTDQVLSFFEDRKKKERSVTRFTEDGVSYVAAE